MSELKLFSWNVNGLRAVLRKGELEKFLATYDPDIFCLQEIKMQPGQAELDLPAYTELWHSAARPGYAGTAIFTKIPPLGLYRNFDALAALDSAAATDFAKTWAELQSDTYGNLLSEGRLLTAEFAHFYLVTVYTPNAKPDLSRLTLREKLWDPAFRAYLELLAAHKPVITCGDFNAAHTEIDLARPKPNRTHAGFTDAERQGITDLIAAGFLDTFRTLHPTDIRYTWWSHWGNARANNVGWRIDYFFISENLRPALTAAEIYEGQLGSDHCPVSITLDTKTLTEGQI